MPSLITKWKKGKPYLYWVRSAWVNGHSRIVEQIYLGPQQRVMEQIRAQFTSVLPPEVMPVLRTVQTREFGASALLYSLAQELGLIDLINADFRGAKSAHILHRNPQYFSRILLLFVS